MAWMRQLLSWQREAADPGEFLDSLRFEMTSTEIFVFTPKGDVINLPAGSTPVDFAYSVHTEVGHRCIGARVDGKLVALEKPLSNGEVVEVSDLEVDESLLTGEADPVGKSIGDQVMSGSFVISGSGAYRAARVGSEAYAAKLAEEATKFTLVKSELRNGINQILKFITYLLIPDLLLRLFEGEGGVASGEFVRIGTQMLIFGCFWQCFDAAGMTVGESLRISGTA